MPEFPLWRLKPEEAARIIVLLPQTKVDHVLKGEHKRIPRIHPSRRCAPRTDDERTLNRAKWHKYWDAYRIDQSEAFPIVGVLLGPLLKNGSYYSQTERIANPLGERERPPFEGLYSRDAYEHDVEYFESARALNRENFILGQQGEGPYIDGLIYMKVDSLLLAEIAHCKARLNTTGAILGARSNSNTVITKQGADGIWRKVKTVHPPSAKEARWHAIGSDEQVAFQFKHSGYEIRKTGLRNYEVLMR